MVWEIELRVEIHYRKIFLVECADLIRLLEIAFKAALEEIDEGLRVAIDIHAHEGGKLEETWIDAPSGARK